MDEVRQKHPAACRTCVCLGRLPPAPHCTAPAAGGGVGPTPLVSEGWPRGICGGWPYGHGKKDLTPRSIRNAGLRRSVGALGSAAFEGAQ